MYHIELRQFPHNFSRFNLTEQALQEAVLDAWARGEWVEVGERKWNSQQANLTVIEGPELPFEQLSMGRGWRNAVRQGTDVTADLLARARARLGVSGTTTTGAVGSAPAGAAGSVWARIAGPAPAEPAMGAGAGQPLAPQPFGSSEASGLSSADDVRARQLLALLGEDPGSLLRAWQMALECHPDRTPSQCLALAEDFVRR